MIKKSIKHCLVEKSVDLLIVLINVSVACVTGLEELIDRRVMDDFLHGRDGLITDCAPYADHRFLLPTPKRRFACHISNLRNPDGFLNELVFYSCAGAHSRIMRLG